MKTLNVLIVAAAVLAGVVFYGEKTATAQNNESDENSALMDSLSNEEDLLDSNVVYESFYDSLDSKGDWMEVKKADFIKAIAGDASDLDQQTYPDDEVIYVWRPWGVMYNTWSPYMN
ncbi:MAG: hypothetical protein LWX07_12885, partial [Bacteroidetes bacterium]|nr:hypothetical protein [Bacteroidota bacterium]